MPPESVTACWANSMDRTSDAPAGSPDGRFDRDTLALVERLEGAWIGREPKIIQRMRVLATLTVLGEILDEVAPNRARSLQNIEFTDVPAGDDLPIVPQNQLLVSGEKYTVKDIAKPDDRKLFSLLAFAFATLHPEAGPSDRVVEAVEVIRKGPGTAASSHTEKKWTFLSSLVKEMGLGKVNPRTLANEWSAWTTQKLDEDTLRWTRFWLRSAAGLDAGRLEVPGDDSSSLERDDQPNEKTPRNGGRSTPRHHRTRSCRRCTLSRVLNSKKWLGPGKIRPQPFIFQQLDHLIDPLFRRVSMRILVIWLIHGFL